MKILFLITKSEIGGAQRFVQEQIFVLNQQGIETFLVTNKGGWLTNSVSGKVTSVATNQGIESKFSFNFFVFLYKYVTKNEIDLVICNSANAGLYGRIISFLTRSKSIYVSHGWSSIYNGGKYVILLNFIEKILSWLGDSVLCISENDYSLAVNKIGIDHHKLFLLPNSILPNKLQIKKKKSEKLRILMVCRLDHPKIPELLIEAVQSMDEKVDLTIVGNGSKYSTLMAMIRQEDDNIHLAGEILAFDNYLDFDVFALVSLSEGLPISALEAMSFGLALILSNVGGCPSLIEDNGVIVNNNVEAITEGIALIKKDIEKYKMNSLSLYDSKFNLLKNTPKYVSYYENIINKR
jgi:glycosyltransferase involved in cell wall biosynthesis